MTKPIQVLVEVDDLNGQKVSVPLELPGQAVPVSHFDRRQAIALRILRIEGPAGGEVERITGEVVEKVETILDGTAVDHVYAARDILAPPNLRREALVEAAAHLLHAIHDIDRTGPIEVRRDDLRRVLDSIDDASWKGVDDAVRRLQDALGGS